MHINKKDSWRLASCTSASQPIRFDSTEERTNLNTPNITSNDIATILPPNRSNNVGKPNKLENIFCPVGEATMTFDV